MRRLQSTWWQNRLREGGWDWWEGSWTISEKSGRALPACGSRIRNGLCLWVVSRRGAFPPTASFGKISRGEPQTTHPTKNPPNEGWHVLSLTGVGVDVRSAD